MSVYLFNIFKGNDNITFVLICLETNSKQTFFIKNVNFEKHIKPSAYSQTLSYIVGKCYELKENCMLIIKTDWSFCGQNLQSVAILYEKLKVFFLNFHFNTFFQTILYCKIPFNHSFLAIPNLSDLLNLYFQKQIMAWKTSALKKKSYGIDIIR